MPKIKTRSSNAIVDFFLNFQGEDQLASLAKSQLSLVKCENLEWMTIVIVLSLPFFVEKFALDL